MREGFYGSLTQNGTLLQPLDGADCRARLVGLMEVICEQRDWSKLDLARALGRRTTVVLSDTQFPTLDFLQTLAAEIGWSTSALATFVLGPDVCWADNGLNASLGGPARPFSPTPEPPWPERLADRFSLPTPRDLNRSVHGASRATCVGAATSPAWTGTNPVFESYDDDAMSSYDAGQARAMLRAARQMAIAASTPDETGLACIRELGAWDLLGLYPRALEVTRRGVETPGLSTALRTCLLTNLALVHCALWQLTEAIALATRLIDEHTQDAHRSGLTDHNEAFAWFIRAEARRRQLVHDSKDASPDACRAERDFVGALQRFRRLARADPTNSEHRAIATRALAGICECRVVTGTRDRERTVARILRALECGRHDHRADGTRLAEGWRCIIGCSILMRETADDPDESSAETRRAHDERSIAILTNKAYEIADQTGDWGLRERVFAIEYNRREANLRHTGVRADWIMDREDVGILAGAMARFPSFRQTGLQIYRAARIV